MKTFFVTNLKPMANHYSIMSDIKSMVTYALFRFSKIRLYVTIASKLLPVLVRFILSIKFLYGFAKDSFVLSLSLAYIY
jgi:hypothetical protein